MVLRVEVCRWQKCAPDLRARSPFWRGREFLREEFGENHCSCWKRRTSERANER